jgi:hypothetical protein
MDLLSAGFTAAGGAIPGAVFESWTIPGYDSYRRVLDGIRRSLGNHGDAEEGGEAAGSIGEFFTRSAPPPPRTFLTAVSPTILEKRDADLRRAGAQGAVPPDAGTGRDDAAAVPGEGSGPSAIDRYIGEAGDEEGRTRFGTLCHLAIALSLDGAAPERGRLVPVEVLERETRRIFGTGRAKKESLRALTEEALEKARNFLESPLGGEAAGASRRCSEFRFVLPVRGEDRTLLIGGSMDLIYESGGRCTVVDFKTDRRVDPEAHRVQMACYRRAAPAFSSLPVRTILFYLRYGVSREIETDMSDEMLLKL